MAEAFDVKFEVKGPAFDGSGLRVMPGIINRGLLDIAILEGSNKVREQLYGPPAHLYWKTDPKQRHGAKSRTLKRAIGVRELENNVIIVDAHSNSSTGTPLNYARKVEDLYHMFANASAAINRNKAQLYQKYIVDALVEAFQ